jgi:hypothetical protein
MAEQVYKEGQETPDGFSIENTLNSNPEDLPFGLYNPETEGKLTWICGYGPTQKGKTAAIVSVYIMDLGDRKERKEFFLENLEEAKKLRNGLIENGWRILIPPKVVFTVSGKNGKSSEMNRKQKRSLGRKLNKLAAKYGPDGIPE